MAAAFFKQIPQGKSLVAYGYGAQVRDDVHAGALRANILRGAGKGLALDRMIAEILETARMRCRCQTSER